MRAFYLPVIDHRGPEFAAVGRKVLREACENFDAWAPAHARAARAECLGLPMEMGLGKLAGTLFRIGPVGNGNDRARTAALPGCEMGLQRACTRPAGR